MQPSRPPRDRADVRVKGDGGTVADGPSPFAAQGDEDSTPLDEGARRPPNSAPATPSKRGGATSEGFTEHGAVTGAALHPSRGGDDIFPDAPFYPFEARVVSGILGPDTATGSSSGLVTNSTAPSSPNPLTARAAPSTTVTGSGSSAPLTASSDSPPGGRVWRWASRARAEANAHALLSWPLVASEIISYIGSLITAAFVGHLGTLELSAYVLGFTMYTITGISIQLGMASAMDTYAGQAYGAKQYPLVGVSLQRASIICLLAAIPSSLVFLFGEEILVAINLEPEVASLVGDFMRTMIWSLVMVGVSDCCSRYLMYQGQVMPTMLITIVTLVCNPLWNYLFIIQFGWRLHGAACVSIADGALFLGLKVIAIFVLNLKESDPARRCWRGFSAKALQGWGDYLAVALPSTAMTCLDWWTFDVVVALAGWLPRPSVAVAAMGIVYRAHALCFLIAYGQGAAVAVRVSHALGAAKPEDARMAMRVGTAITCGTQVAMAILWAVGARWFVRAFTEDRAVEAEVMRSVLLVAGAMVVDCLNIIIAGIMKVTGRQVTGMGVNFGAFWVVGLPLAHYLSSRAFGGLGTLGLWAGLAVASTLSSGALAAIVALLDWPREVERTRARLDAQGATGEGPAAPLLADEAGAAA